MPRKRSDENGVPVVASGTCGEHLAWSLDSSGKLSISGSGAMSDYSKTKESPWTGDRFKITSAEIFDGVTRIGEYAFYMCLGLRNITIPDSVTSIGESAFSGCIGLKQIEIPGSVAAIESITFSSCRGLESIVIPDSVTSIKAIAFGECWNLTDIRVSAGNPRYTAENGILYNKDKTKLIAWPAARNDVTVPGSVTKIGDAAFWGCKYLRFVTVPDSVTSVGAQALYRCENLENVTFGRGVASIGNKMIAKNKNLDSITFMGNAPSFDPGALVDAAVTLYYPSGNSTWTDSVRQDYGGTIVRWESYNPQAGPAARQKAKPAQNAGTDPSAAEACGNDLNWRIVRERLFIMGVGAMNDYSHGNSPWDKHSDGITSAEICAGVTHIGDFAFWCCLDLADVKIGDTVSSIGDSAFESCKELGDITIPGNMVSIGESAFSGCTKLGTITFEGNAPVIGENAFRGVKATAYYPAGNAAWTSAARQNYGGSIRWKTYTPNTEASGNARERTIQVAAGACGEQLKWRLDRSGNLAISGYGAMGDYSIGQKAPWDSKRYMIESVVMDPGITYIGSHAFFYCEKLTQVFIPDGVSFIGDNAFSGCGSLKSVAIPATVTSIGDSAFDGCQNLESVQLTDGLVSIGNDAFSSCSVLKSLRIPDSVVSIGKEAFTLCAALTDLVVSSGNPAYSAANGALYNKDRTQLVAWPAARGDVSIPAGVTSIGDDAFSFCTYLKTLRIPGSVTSIGNSAFSHCKNLQNLTIPRSVTRIGNLAFIGCANLTSVSFAGDAPNIESRAFSGVTATAYYPSGNRSWKSTALKDYGGSIRWVPSAAKTGTSANAAGKTVSGACGKLVIWTLDDSGKLRISGTGAMTDYRNDEEVPWYSYHSSITSAEVCQGVTSLGMYAFCSCYLLSDISIPGSVTAIGNGAFSLCKSLKSIEISDSVKSIGVLAFSGCESLTGLRVSAGNARYSSENGILYNKDKTTLLAWPTARDDIMIPSGVTSVEFGAFAFCDHLKSVTIPDSVVSVGGGAFNRCGNLNTVTVGSRVAGIGNNAFNGCKNLNFVTFRGNAPDIGTDAFKDVSAKMYYPAGNPSWTSGVLQNYGGTPQWTPCEPKAGEPVYAGEQQPDGGTYGDLSGAGSVQANAFDSGKTDYDHILSQIVSEHPEALDDRKKLNALLTDLMPQEKLVRNTLLMAFDEGIVSDFKEKNVTDELAFHRYKKILTDNYGISDSLAEQAIRIWNNALMDFWDK